MRKTRRGLSSAPVKKGTGSRFCPAPASRLRILLVELIVSMTWLKSPSFLCSPTGPPTLVDSSAPMPVDPAPLPNGPRRGGRSPGGKDRPRANHGEGRDRRAPSIWEAVRLREANWYPTRNVGASEAIQIAANRAECVCPWIDHIRDEKLPASTKENTTSLMSIKTGTLSAAKRQLKNPPANSQPQGLRARVPPADETVQPSRKLVLNPSDDLPKIDAMIHCAPS
jgi:hypothetical protein